jgi:peptidoglycan/xylan/chitin deacetylase (PgdA/CDA1 family)
METQRYDYQPIIERAPLKWPDGARVALWVCPNIECFHIDCAVRAPGAAPHLPDVAAYSLRDYGSRVGVFRMMEVFDKHGIRASVLLNAEVCDRHPRIIEEGKRRNWEWLGHGLTNNAVLSSYAPEKQVEVIRQVKDRIAAAVGTAPKGWLGPGLDETFDTPDHLAAEGFEYLCDWSHDDQPVPMRVRSGRMITVPYSQGINDFPVFVQGNHTPQEYYQMVCDQFDTLYAEGATSGRVMAIPLHPFITGLPFRIKYLDKALDYIVSHDCVWRATGWEIAAWYYRNYYTVPQ